MEEKNVNKLNEYDDCCCGPQPPEPPRPRPNHCQEGCCEAKEIDPHYMDIKHARCIPILADRIYDCINVESGGMKYVPLTFRITTPHPYVTGDEICIKRISVTYDFIGLINDVYVDSYLPGPLPVIVDNIGSPQQFVPADCSPSCLCDGYTLYNTYAYAVETNLDEWCHDKGRKSKIAVTDAEFYVCNLNIFVDGKIGCHHFEAVLDTPYSGPLVDLGDLPGKGLKSLDFLGNMCFPAGNACLNMELKFRSKLGFDCIRANDKYSDTDRLPGQCPTFKASGLASLFTKLQVYSTVKEELVVYTTPHGVICDDCDDEKR